MVGNGREEDKVIVDIVDSAGFYAQVKWLGRDCQRNLCYVTCVSLLSFAHLTFYLPLSPSFSSNSVWYFSYLEGCLHEVQMWELVKLDIDWQTVV